MHTVITLTMFISYVRLWLCDFQCDCDNDFNTIYSYISFYKQQAYAL